MSQPNNRRESRFFTGGQSELSKIKSKEQLQRFLRYNRTKKQVRRVAAVLGFILACVVFVVLCLSVFFEIRTIEVVGSARYSADAVIEACGVKKGVSLYSVSNGDVQGVTRRLAYIREARVRYKLPSTLVISVTEDTPVFFTELYGEYFILSDELRILDRYFERSDAEALSLVELVFPAINSALVGDRVEFENDSTQKYITTYIDVLLDSDLFEKVSALDLRSRFEMSVICEDIYLVHLGNGDELGTKLTAVAGMLNNEVFQDRVPATIDATDPSECPVIKNPDAVIAFDRK